MIVIVAKLKTCRENIEEMKAALLDMVSKVKMKKAPWFTPCIRTTEIPPFFCFMKNIKMPMRCWHTVPRRISRRFLKQSSRCWTENRRLPCMGNCRG
jgi:hypothetical protein